MGDPESFRNLDWGTGVGREGDDSLFHVSRCPRTASCESFPFPLQDKDKVSLTKTPKLDRSDGGKEVKERATKRKLPFTVGTNGDQKDSDTGKGLYAPNH